MITHRRFEGRRRTKPEELIASAHAGRFTIALFLIVGQANLTAERMDTSAEEYLEQVESASPIELDAFLANVISGRFARSSV